MIGVIFTGGTIGSSVGDDYIGMDSAKKKTLINMYTQKYGEEDFAVDCPYEILSENLTPDYFPLLVQSVEQMAKKTDGIIITHGSDTIQYSASLLSYVISADIPVLIVCSNYVLEDERANGLTNFAAAVKFIKNKCGKGVFVPYCGKDGVAKIYFGNSILRHDLYSDEIRGVLDRFYGYFENDTFVYTEQTNPCELKSYAMPVKGHYCNDILVIHSNPGMIYPMETRAKAVIICAYHSGTLCTNNKDLVEFANKMYEMGISIYLLGATEGMDYESCKIYEDLKLIKAPIISESSMFIEVWLKINGAEIN